MFRESEAATIHAYALPAGTTVVPESETRAITISPDGTVAATVSTIGRFDIRTGVRWQNGARTILKPIGIRPNPRGPFSVRSHFENIVAAPGGVFVTAGFFFSGAYSGDITQVQHGTQGGVFRWSRPACVTSGTEEDEQMYGADDAGQLALTMDKTGAGSFMVLSDDAGEYAPYAYVLSHGKCRFLGRGVVRAVRGNYAAGDREYRNGHLAATNISVQHFVAVRWIDTRMSELGDGLAFAINVHGLAVGASRLPGPFSEIRAGAPQPAHLEALAWDLSGRRIRLVSDAIRSAAYDVADDGTIVGTLIARGGKHYAFRYRDGKLERLDDLQHPRGWRFESAYAISSDGSIYGVGTLAGVASIFKWHA